jgi:hypothetical protein
MANFDASTPQLNVIKNWIDATSVLDTGKYDMVLARNFKYQSFPKTVDVPEMTKGKMVQWVAGVFASMTKMEVRIQRPRTTLKITD